MIKKRLTDSDSKFTLKYFIRLLLLQIISIILEMQPSNNKELVCTVEHEFRPIIKVCTKLSCRSDCLACQKCLQEIHKGPQHEVLNLEQFVEYAATTLSKNNQNIDQLFLEELRQSKERLLQKITHTQLSMYSMIKKLKLAVNNQFETIIQSYNSSTYKNEKTSLKNDLSAKRITNACYKILVIKRNQFNGNILNVKIVEDQYNKTFQSVEPKLKEIFNEFDTLKYVNELTMDRSHKQQREKNVISQPPEKTSMPNPAISPSMEVQPPVRSLLNEKKLMTKKGQKAYICIQSSQQNEESEENERSREKISIKQSPKRKIASSVIIQRKKQQQLRRQSSACKQKKEQAQQNKMEPFNLTNIIWKKMNQSQVYTKQQKQKQLEEKKLLNPSSTKQKLILSEEKQLRVTKKPSITQDPKRQSLTTRKNEQIIKSAQGIYRLKLVPNQESRSQDTIVPKTYVHINPENQSDNNKSGYYKISTNESKPWGPTTLQKIKSNEKSQKSGQKPVQKPSQKLSQRPVETVTQKSQKPSQTTEKTTQKKKTDSKDAPKTVQNTISSQKKHSSKPSEIKPTQLDKKHSASQKDDPKQNEGTRKTTDKSKDPRKKASQKSSGTYSFPTKPNQVPAPIPPPPPKEQIIYHENYVEFKGVKRPLRRPSSMTDEQLHNFFNSVYKQKQVYSMILSHRSLDGGKRYEYMLYFNGQIQWVSQQSVIQSDQMIHLREYWSAQDIYNKNERR